MKYAGFREEIEKLGYQVDNNLSHNIFVVTSGGKVILSVSKKGAYIINSNHKSFIDLEDLEKERLLGLAWQLASTPIDKRKDEKGYRLKLPFIKSYGYLNLDEIDGVYELSTEVQANNYQTIFAESEVEELKQNYNLDSFVMEEVKEDE